MSNPTLPSEQAARPDRPDRTSTTYLTALRTSLKWDEERDEPYLLLPSFSDYRITPTRKEDVDDLVELFNHPSIGERLFRLPYPMPREKAVEMVDEDISDAAPILQTLHDLHVSNSPIFSSPASSSSTHSPNDLPLPIPGCPFHQLRHHPTSKIIANISLRPHTYPFHPNPPTEEEVNTWPAERRVWDLGYVLDPRWGGKGIMGEMVGCFLEGWVGLMGVGTVGAFAEFDNPASVRVLNKNGLRLVSSHTTDWPEDKGGGTRETGRFERVMIRP